MTMPLPRRPSPTPSVSPFFSLPLSPVFSLAPSLLLLFFFVSLTLPSSLPRTIVFHRLSSHSRAADVELYTETAPLKIIQPLQTEHQR